MQRAVFIFKYRNLHRYVWITQRLRLVHIFLYAVTFDF